MQIEVEPAPQGTAFLLILGLLAAGVATLVSYTLGKRSGLSERPDVQQLDQARERAKEARRQMRESERRLAAARR